MACPFFFAMATVLSNDTLELLVRNLTPQALWEWLSHDTRLALRGRITQGFRETPTALRQPIARKRLVTHLQNTPDDAQDLLDMWSRDSKDLLAAVRQCNDDTELGERLPALHRQYGEALQLALIHEERECAPLPAADEAIEATSQESTATLQKQLQRSRKKIEELRSKLHDSKANSTETEKRLQEKLRQAEAQAREATRTARQFELKLELLQEKLAASEKEQDRSERRARKALAENQELLAETKTLRRQIHRLQQIGEELRGKLAATQEANLPPNQQRSVEGVNTLPDKKQQQEAASASLPVANDAQKIRDAIDRNDEVFVANLRRSLETLHEQNPAAHKSLLTQLRKSGRYYERVLRQATTRVLVDASNIARHDGPGRGKLEYLHAMRAELQRFDFFPIIFVADASLPYHIDQPDEFRRMMKNGQILISASGQEADEILARMARETGAYVVTNDRHFHRHLAPAFTPLRIGFRIEEGVVFLDEFYLD